MNKKKTYKPKPEKIQKAKEASSPYQGMEITFCNSFEEMNEHQYLSWLSLTPEQRVEQATYLLESLFHEKLKTIIKKRKIIFN